MDGVGKGRLGMITTFCQSDQMKVESSDALLTLIKQNLPMPGVVVVKVFTNLPYLPWRSFGCPNLDITTLSLGAFNCPIPTCPAAVVQVAPIFFHPGHPSVRERVGWAKSLPIPHGDPVGELRRGASFVPTFGHCQSPSSPLIPNRDKSAQTEEVLGFSLSLRQLQAVTQAKDQLEWGLRSLASAPKIKMYPCHRNLATVFAVWLGVT